ncbi:NUDIX domain-containing protein [Microvirga tunisiensis]|uniref:NUDIX domain-containing protein n=1 Tax=Pannonibacter tanglangensis TaxID=2750084 RepID=A0A7X5J6Y2_9HYPH|nr:NUDIX domain-containing protein [Pannonibacter sp. XCT-53]NBN76862.1 NUDIX domain-containing protein [Pannonibacter sp. XCT-53]
MQFLLSMLPARLTRRIIHGAALVRHAHTLGVRVIVRDAAGYVLLVRHTYLPGWYLPGGGVDVGETLSEAAAREIFEETGIRARGEPVLLGLYHNRETTRRDHVALFELPDWDPPTRSPVPNAEIAEARFFAPDQLPPDITSATARRLDELAGRMARSALW